MNPAEHSSDFDPVAPLPLLNGTRLHESSRTSMSTNAGASGQAEMQLTTGRLTLDVERGALLIRFSGHGTAVANDRQFRSPRRGREGL